MDKLKQFVIWLDGFMQACGPELNEQQTSIVKNKLNGLFEHEADKLSIEPKLSLEELGEQHGFQVNQGFPNIGFPSRDENGQLYRC